MKGMIGKPRARSLVVLVVVFLMTGAAFALIGSFKVSYGGVFSYAADATTPTNLNVEARGVGLAAFGNSTLAVRMTLDTTLAPNKITQGGFLIIAPNGDQARGLLTGGASNADANGYRRMVGKYKFTGGTGRFANVQGLGNWNGITRTDGDGRGLINFNFDGTIGN